MADRLWYAALAGKQAGPFGEAQVRDMIARGEITADTLVWSAPMPQWVKAGEVPDLIPATHQPPPMPAAAPPPPPPPPSSVPPVAASSAPPPSPTAYRGGEPGQPLAFTGGPFALLGRTILVVIGQYLVIPSPWTTTAFYRWFIAHIELPNRVPVAFTGKGGDIWYIFMLSALCVYAGLLHPLLPLITVPLSVLFYVIILRWFFTNLTWEGQATRLTFTGGFWPLLGWFLFMAAAMITIIGWAWVLTATLRWMCRHIEGTNKRLSFVGGGWSLLWRIWVASLASAFIIPIPWMLRWYMRWLVSQFHLSDRL